MLETQCANTPSYTGQGSIKRTPLGNTANVGDGVMRRLRDSNGGDTSTQKKSNEHYSLINLCVDSCHWITMRCAWNAVCKHTFIHWLGFDKNDPLGNTVSVSGGVILFTGKVCYLRLGRVPRKPRCHWSSHTFMYWSGLGEKDSSVLHSSRRSRTRRGDIDAAVRMPRA